jgi:predicted nucleotidyltransferase
MDLTPEQHRAITAWAARTRCITEVRLFGSRAKGSAHIGSDIDLAVTIIGDHTGDAFSIYMCDCRDWEAELTALTGLPADVERYDREGAPRVFGYCQEASVLLYSRNA